MLDPFALNEKGTFHEYCLFILYSLSLQHSSFHQHPLSFPFKGVVHILLKNGILLNKTHFVHL